MTLLPLYSAAPSLKLPLDCKAAFRAARQGLLTVGGIWIILPGEQEKLAPNKEGPLYISEGHYNADIGVVNKEAEYIRDATIKEKVYHICKREIIDGKEDFRVGRINYDPYERRYYCESCHILRPIKDFWREPDGTGTEGHA